MSSQWSQSPLSKCLAKVIDYRGRTPKKLGKEWASSGYRALSANNVKFSGLDKLESINYADEDLYKIWMKEEVCRGDLLLTSEAPSGQVMLWDSDEKIVLSQRLYALRANSQIDAAFLKYYLQSPSGQKEIFRNNSGSTVAGISAKTFNNILIRHPEKGIQQRIGYLLYSIDKKIDCNNRINAELEAMAKTLYDYWFVQFDFPDANGKPYKSSGGKMVYNATLKREIPEGWSDAAVADILGRVPSSTKVQSKDFLDIGDIPVIDQSQDYICGFTDEKASLISVEEPHVVFGDHTRVIKLVNFCYARGADGTQVLVSKDMRMPGYLMYQVVSDIDLSSYGYARHFKFLKESRVVLPDQAIAQKYQDAVTVLFEKKRALIFEGFELARLRDWLLPLLMNGQVTVA